MDDTTITGFDKDSGPLKTYDEKLELAIGNLISRNTQKGTFDNKETVLIITDLSALTIELLEFIEEYGKKSTVSN